MRHFRCDSARLCEERQSPGVPWPARVRTIRLSPKRRCPSNDMEREEPDLVRIELSARTCLAALAIALLAGATAAEAQTQPASTQSAPAAPPATQASGIEDIIVTANRHTENVQSVPLSITALPAEEILHERIQSTSDLGRIVPTITDAGLPAVSGGGLTIRGIRGNDRSAGADPPNALFVDGVYYGRPEDGDSLLFDLERIEVLRGTQGTLFGKNVVGGAINATTRAPSDHLRALVIATYGNYNRIEGQALVSGPLIEDRLLGSLAVQTSSADGYVHNVTTGNDLMGTSRNAVKARLDFKPSPTFTSSLQAIYERVRDGGVASYEISNPALPPDIYPVGIDVPREAAQNIDGFRDRDAWALVATQTYSGDHIGAKSITAYRHTINDTLYDVDGTASPITSQDQHDRYRQFSQEFQISSPDTARTLKWVAGLYYFRATTNQLTINVIRPPDGTYVNVLNTQLGFGPGPHTTPNSQDVTATNYAAFGQATLAVTPRLNFTGGIRYTIEKKTGLSQTYGDRDVSLFLGTPELPLPIQGGPLTGRIAANLDKTWRAWTPRFAVDWTPIDHVMLYASASRGFKGGGFTGQNSTQATIGRTFNPEFAWDYEGGIKSRFLDNHVQLNATAYQMDYSNLQVTTIIGTSRVTDNAANARIRGIELESTFIPFRDLTASLSYAYTDAKYLNYIDGSGRDLSGNQFPGVSKSVLNFRTDYMIEDVGGGDLTLSGGLTYRSRRPNDSVNSPQVTDKPVTTFDAGITYAKGDIELRAWGRNLTDERYVVVASDVTAFFHLAETTASPAVSNFLVNYSPPRTFGLTFTWHYH